MLDTVANVNALNYSTARAFSSIFFVPILRFHGDERAEAISQLKTITEDFLFIYFFSNSNVQVHFIQIRGR